MLGPGEAVAAEPELTAAVDVVRALVDAGVPRRRAAELVARLTPVNRNTLYAQSLQSD